MVGEKQTIYLAGMHCDVFTSHFPLCYSFRGPFLIHKCLTSTPLGNQIAYVECNNHNLHKASVLLHTVVLVCIYVCYYLQSTLLHTTKNKWSSHRFSFAITHIRHILSLLVKEISCSDYSVHWFWLINFLVTTY